MMRLPGPNTTQAVISAGPIALYHARFFVELVGSPGS